MQRVQLNIINFQNKAKKRYEIEKGICFNKNNLNEFYTRGSLHRAILATLDLSYLLLTLRLPALIFTSVPRANFKTIVNPAHVENIVLFHLTG